MKKTIKIIDLFNMMANKEELPKRFILDNHIFYLQKGCLKYYYRCDEINQILEDYFILEQLNNEIEIISDEEEFKKYVNEMNKNIHEKLKDNKDELDFYEEVVIQFNNVCQERNDLEQALDEIEKICRQRKYYTGNTRRDETNGQLIIEQIETTLVSKNDILNIINKAKGEKNNEFEC